MSERNMPGTTPDGEPEPLGTAATFRKGDESGTGNTKQRTPRRPRLGMGWGAALIALLVVGFALVPALGSALRKTPRDRVGISYGGGPFEGSHFQKVVEPGHGLFFNGFFDPLYLYPADQQNYIVDSSASEEDETNGGSVVAPSADRVQIDYQVAVYYKLNTDELRAFHEELGLRYEAFNDGGWNRLVEDTLRQQIENALQEETRRYEVSQIYGDADLLVKIQDSVQVTLGERLEAAMGGSYFCAPTFEPGGECEDPVFIIKRANVPESVRLAYEENRTSDLDVITRRNEVEQRIEEARGIEALNAALAEGGEAYVLLKAIESGKINFWVLPSDGSVDLTAPADGLPSAGDAPTGG